jgi:hypothetical protein
VESRRVPSGHIALLLFAVVFICVSLAPVCGNLAYGQVASGNVSGTVSDETNAVVPDVQIQLRNAANAFERVTKTDRHGAFMAPFLPPGRYIITAERQGFVTSELRDVLVNVNDQLSVAIQLKVGGSSESVTVVAEASRASVTAGVGTVVDRQFIANMPLNGRSLQALLQLVPGVILTPDPLSGSETGAAAAFSVNGQRTTANYFMVDGVSANTGVRATFASLPADSGGGQAPATTALGGTSTLASLDAVQEFRTETSTFAAEFGRTPGGQISLVTRSGTNVVHGSASEYFRHDAMDANDWFANSRNQPKPRERQNLFSGVLGGPILQNRVFFFGSYERLQLKQPRATHQTVPTAELRAQVPVAVRPYLDALPLPNGPSTGSGVAELTASYSDPGSFDVPALRLDVHGGRGLTSFVRVNHASSQTQTRTQSLSTVSHVRAENDAVTAGVTWVLSSSTTADLRVNWARNAPRTSLDLEPFGGAVVPAKATLFQPGRDPGQAYFAFSSVGSFSWGAGNQDLQRQINAVGTFSWLLGGHQVKLGLDYRRLRPLFGAGPYERLAFRGNDVQSLLNGVAFYYLVSSADSKQREATFSNLSLYAQDAWRATDRFTLTYGVRLERVPAPTEAGGRTPRTLLGIESDPLQNPRLAPEGTPLWRGRAGELAPRLGAAYQLSTRPSWEITLRGGAGVFYDLGLGNVANSFQNVYPFVAGRITFNPTLPLLDTIRVPPALGIDPPGSMYLLDPNLRLPYTMQWNVAYEHALGSAQGVTLTYVGAAGRRLLLEREYFNQSLADWPSSSVGLRIQRNLGQSSYRALQVQYRRRLDHGLQALASYTLASARDNGSTDYAVVPPAGSSTVLLSEEFGPSSFDVRHQAAVAVTYDLPKPAAGPLTIIARDWGIDTLVRTQSAFPVTPIANGVQIGREILVPRPDLVARQPLYIQDSSVPGGSRFNRAAFVAPASLQGTFPRNGLRAFGAWQVDVAVRREIGLTTRARLQIKAEFFNVFNHPNFGGPFASINDGLFGQPSEMLNRSLGGLNSLYQMGGPRSAELAAKIAF